MRACVCFSFSVVVRGVRVGAAPPPPLLLLSFLPMSLVAVPVHCLVLGVHVQVALQRPHVLVAVARRGHDLEADVAEGVEDDDASALQPDAVLRVPALLVLHVLGEFALELIEERVI